MGLPQKPWCNFGLRYPSFLKTAIWVYLVQSFPSPSQSLKLTFPHVVRPIFAKLTPLRLSSPEASMQRERSWCPDKASAKRSAEIGLAQTSVNQSTLLPYFGIATEPETTNMCLRSSNIYFLSSMMDRWCGNFCSGLLLCVEKHGICLNQKASFLGTTVACLLSPSSVPMRKHHRVSWMEEFIGTQPVPDHLRSNTIKPMKHVLTSKQTAAEGIFHGIPTLDNP